MTPPLKIVGALRSHLHAFERGYEPVTVLNAIPRLWVPVCRHPRTLRTHHLYSPGAPPEHRRTQDHARHLCVGLRKDGIVEAGQRPARTLGIGAPAPAALRSPPAYRRIDRQRAASILPRPGARRTHRADRRRTERVTCSFQRPLYVERLS